MGSLLTKDVVRTGVVNGEGIHYTTRLLKIGSLLFIRVSLLGLSLSLPSLQTSDVSINSTWDGESSKRDSVHLDKFWNDRYYGHRISRVFAIPHAVFQNISTRLIIL